MSLEDPLVTPHNVEVERNVLGVLMLVPQRIGEVAERLDAHDFFFPLHRKIYVALLQLDGAGRAVDIFTLHEVLADDKELVDAGGIVLSSLDKLAYKKAPREEYCRILRESASLRRLLVMVRPPGNKFQKKSLWQN